AVTGALERLRIDDAPAGARRWPHQWSGGMLQRATIAAASALGPALIVADEPTSALDADRATATMEALRDNTSALLLVSHDARLVAAHAERVAVCYGGRIIETGATADVFAHPRHPYTAGLLAALPRPGAGLPRPLPGGPPDLRQPEAGCGFCPRCDRADVTCANQLPPLAGGVACWRPLPGS
ncbi:MAG: oligopeptide/dipeptide ABC transporter ATP-binding protein, partial [Acidimicrobiia bacterium]